MTGGVDLSIGTGLVCYSLVGGYLIVYQGWPTWAGMLVSILMGCAVGVLNGCLVALMDLPPFLATLCTCMITRGLGSIIVGGFGISWPAAAAEGGWFRSIFKIQVNGTNIPIGFIWIILLVILMTFVLNHTKDRTLYTGDRKQQRSDKTFRSKRKILSHFRICDLRFLRRTGSNFLLRDLRNGSAGKRSRI